jgi:hypothetical protein
MTIAERLILVATRVIPADDLDGVVWAIEPPTPRRFARTTRGESMLIAKLDASRSSWWAWPLSLAAMEHTETKRAAPNFFGFAWG